MRFVPVLALLVLAPWVGEYLLGNVSGRDILLLPFLAPLYGGGALLIREVTRRTGRGWPTILLLGAAYGVIEAGLVDQSLFHPPLSPEPTLETGAANAVAFVVGHAVWSIGVPIALVESWAGRTPWLGRVGLVATAALYVAGCLIIFGDQREATGFVAAPTERLAVVAAALALIVAAFAAGRSDRATRPGSVPRPLLVGLGGFVGTSLFFARPETWFGVGLGIALLVVAWIVISRWSRRVAWSDRHRFALAAGTLLTYAWGGFVLTALLEPDDPVRWVFNAVFAVIAVALVAVTARRVSVRAARESRAPRART